MNGAKVGKSGGGANLERGKEIMNLILDTSKSRILVGHSGEDSPSSKLSLALLDSQSCYTRLVMMSIGPIQGWDYIS